jgi:methylmalonyl-CoA mutase
MDDRDCLPMRFRSQSVALVCPNWLTDAAVLLEFAPPAMLKRLQQAVINNANVFEVLMDAVRVCSLGQITNALFEVGGQYRRNM